MWGWVADSASAQLCRGYDAALGHFPAACLTNSGTPALAISGIAILAVWVCLAMLRSMTAR